MGPKLNAGPDRYADRYDPKKDPINLRDVQPASEEAKAEFKKATGKDYPGL